MSTIAEVMTLETTWNFQWVITDKDTAEVTYSWYSQCEYVSEQACRETAESCYSGTIPYRLIKIERHIIEN